MGRRYRQLTGVLAMAWKQPVLADRIREDIAEIKLECRTDGHDLAERFALNLQQARLALANGQRNEFAQQDGPWKYVFELHEARIAALEQELMQLAEPLEA